MNTSEFCKQLNLKKTTLYQYMYVGVLPRAKKSMKLGKRGRPAFDWTRDELRKAKKILAERSNNHGGARKGSGPKPKPKPKATAKAKSARKSSRAGNRNKRGNAAPKAPAPKRARKAPTPAGEGAAATA